MKVIVSNKLHGVIICIIFAFGVNWSISYAFDTKLATGKVREISRSHITLDSALGHISSIGFLCDPDICDSTSNIKVGDEVLLQLGAIDGKNKLLAIRKCHVQDNECAIARDQEKVASAEFKEAHQKSMEEKKSCRVKMLKELANEFGVMGSGENQTSYPDSGKVFSEYNAMAKSPAKMECMDRFVSKYRDAFLSSCIKYGCGKNVGGGCYHLVGYSVDSSVLRSAMNKCE